MATNTTTTLSDKVRDVLNKAVEIQFSNSTLFLPLTEEKQHRNGTDAEQGDVVDFYIDNAMDPVTEALSETSDPTSTTIYTSKKQVTLEEHGNLVKISKKLDLTSFDNMRDVARLVAKNAAESTDQLIQEELQVQSGSDYVRFAGGNTAKTGIDNSAGDSLDLDVIREAAAIQDSYNVEPIDRLGEKVLYIHPMQKADLFGDSTAVSGFNAVGTYITPDNGEIFRNNEIGKLAGYRIVETNAVRVEYYAGATLQPDTTIAGAHAAGATTVSVAAATGIVAGDIVNFEIGSDWYSHVVTGVSTNDLTIGPAFRKNGYTFNYARVAGLAAAAAGGETAREAHPVFTAYFLGKQALAYAYGMRPMVAESVDMTGMQRLRNVYWYAFHNVGELRPESLLKFYTGSTFKPQR